MRVRPVMTSAMQRMNETLRPPMRWITSPRRMSSPAKTPRPLINTLNREVGSVLNLPDIKERLLTQGATVAPTTPEEFDAFIRSEVKRFAKVLIAAGARIN